MLDKLTKLIAERIAPWKKTPILQEIFHSEDPEAVARSIYQFCEKEFGQQPVDALFFFASVGVVSGLCMPDGQRIVIKAHKPERSLAFLTQMGNVQRYLSTHGYPCPQPLAAPRPLAYGLATIDELIDEGDHRDAHEPVIRKAIATALFQQIQLLRNIEQTGIDVTLFDLRLPSDVLWPKPHSAIFNFEATQDGAEWIDKLAWKVKKVIERDEEPPVLAHGDFSTNQMRFIGNHLRIVYDWDSLTLSSELIRVGRAASSFTYTEQPEIVNSETSLEDTQAFIADYENARQKPFTASEHRIIQAGLLSGQLYGARCWHALEPHAHHFTREWYENMLATHSSIF